MDAWVLWLIAAVVLAVAEVINLSFFLFPFAIVTAASFAVVRPIAKRHLHVPPQIRTGTAALVGQTAVVLERIDNDAGLGRVRLEGEVWTARAYDDDRVIEPGARVHVMEIGGATALVSD